ncbi:hypothetical protein [Colwellia echini]|uniref:Uncharacterized protein n=1 Tax=Colwellia echini TaxID=1982103 RepID=A0ABY3MW58_9GAMM|nr:hypothetical protein [Colwellia echini]TYK65447.1 hypothetical protein CWS31_010145 [Colwellia echini]
MINIRNNNLIFNTIVMSEKSRFLIRNVISLSLFLLFLMTLNACSTNNNPNELTEVNVIAQGQSIATRPEMVDSCKGFFVSAEKLKSFYHYSSSTNEESISAKAKSLPCFVSGEAYIGDQKYQWILRSGGIGEFYNEHNTVTKICGIACCKNVPGVC